MLIKSKELLKQRGDTIVEVLICLTIVAGSLVLSYSTARKSLNQIRDSQERGEMLSISQTELERLKQQIKNPADAKSLIDQIDFDKGSPSIANRIFCLVPDPASPGGLKVRIWPSSDWTNPSNTTCAVDRYGNYYTGASTDYKVVDLTHPYRAAIIYRPCSEQDGKPEVTGSCGDVLYEWYAVAGRFAAGGGGTPTTPKTSDAPLMYRQQPL